jgi:protein SCO1/2
MKRFIFLILIFFLLACNSGLPVKGEFPDMPLKNQEGKEVTFSQLRGKVLVVSYIYTHCPDICHIISARMNVFKDKLKQNNIQDKVYFVSITLDPERDTPEVLRHHAKMMNLDLTNWVFVTGEEDAINSTIKAAGMEAIKGPTEFSESGEPSYVIAHRDRISLVDKKGRIRKHYKGTTFDMDELLGDIKSLL